MIEKLIKKQNIRFFIQQALGFGGIFLMLAVIVISVLKQTSYGDVDRNIKEIIKSPVNYIIHSPNSPYFFSDTIMQGDYENNKSDTNFGFSTKMGFFTDQNKFHPLAEDDYLEDIFSKIKFKNLEKNKIAQLQIKDVYGLEQTFRYEIRKIPKSINAKTIKARYIIVFTSVNQVSRATQHSITTVICCMIIFWLVSLIVSIYLSVLSMKPVLLSWRKQQEFVENASHELRTPLAVIQNKLELLFTKPEEAIIDHSEEIGEALGEIRRMRQLTTDLLTLARSDVEKIEAKIMPTEIAEEIKNLIKNYQLLGEIEDKKIILEISDNFPKKIATDSKLIQQLIIILLDNALKYTDKKEGIRVVLGIRQREWTIAVEDTGIGIPEKQKKDIFERFTRVDSSRNRKTGGFGLGLSIANQIVIAFKGKITVVDNAPKGSVFKVTLPII